MNQITSIPTDWRALAEEALAGGKYRQAHALISAWWNTNQTISVASGVLQLAHAMRVPLNLPKCAVRVLRSCTFEPALPVLRAGAFAFGLDIEASCCPFNCYAQEILDPASELYSGEPQIVILAISTRAVAPALWSSQPGATASDLLRIADDVTSSFRRWLELIRSRSNAAVIVHSLEEPDHAAGGVLDTIGQVRAIRRINESLHQMAAGMPDVYVLDYDALVARYGRLNWWDEPKWRAMRVPVRAEYIPAIASEWLRFILPLRGRIAKVAVTDLDNTLWGGILGEDGFDGIRTGDSETGIAFREYQRALLDIQQRGILLAIASKNNPSDVLEALERHPGLLLRAQHFSAIYTNWTEKSANMREIATELNVGLDSLVFLDDNPVERQHIRMDLPEVTVLEMPAEPSGYARIVRDCPLFERLSFSQEDAQRTEYYVQQRERRQLEQNSGSVEEFLHSLRQKVEVLPVDAQSLARVAQLTQKTNQFNLTTRRYSEAEIRQLAATSGNHIFAVRVTDRFGDNGIVGTCILHQEGRACHIDALLLSCRVIGRSVESAMLSAVADWCRHQGADSLEGWFLPTKKNAPASDFFSRHGFQLVRKDEASALWTLDLNTVATPCPPWIQLTVHEEPALV